MRLELKEIHKSFQNNVVLNGFSMTLETGEVVVIQGPSGVGKTTILRCINQLETIDDGNIMLDNQCFYERKKVGLLPVSSRIQTQIRQNIGCVFQNYQLFPHLSIKENLMEAPIYHKQMSHSRAKAKAMVLLEKLGIGDKMDAYPFQLSGGQKQRAAIARACMLSPQVLCFDEPTAALDPKSIEGVAALIQYLAREGMGILVVSHDAGFAQQIATRLIVL